MRFLGPYLGLVSGLGNDVLGPEAERDEEACGDQSQHGGNERGDHGPTQNAPSAAIFASVHGTFAHIPKVLHRGFYALPRYPE
jgi:hypothetical protein